MKNKYLLLILPISILIFGGISLFYFISTTYLSFSIYFALLCLVAIFTAKQSVFIQTSFIWDLDDLDKKEKEILALSLVRDFGIFLFMHSMIATVLYLGLYWVYTLI